MKCNISKGSMPETAARVVSAENMSLVAVYGFAPRCYVPKSPTDNWTTETDNLNGSTVELTVVLSLRNRVRQGLPCISCNPAVVHDYIGPASGSNSVCRGGSFITSEASWNSGTRYPLLVTFETWSHRVPPRPCVFAVVYDDGGSSVR